MKATQYIITAFILAFLVVSTATARGQFNYIVTDGMVAITD